MIAYVILGVILVGYAVYMIFVFPKNKKKWEADQAKVDSEWLEKKQEILDEYFSNNKKFGLVTEAVDGEKIIGMMSASIPKDLSSKLLQGLKDAATLSKTVDMAHYYLVATDKSLRYIGFDGEKCFVNQVFNYIDISNTTSTKEKLTFDYKDEKISFNIADTISGYPRFNIHERSKAPTANDRTRNYFVREYFAFEPSENAAFTQSNQVVPKFNMSAMQSSPEKLTDFKVRQYLVTELKQKLGIQ